MANQSSRIDNQDDPAMSSAQAELLQTVLDSEQYPWLPGEGVGTEDSSAKEPTAKDPLEAAGQALEFSDEEAQQGWSALSTQLNQLWAGTNDSFQQALAQKFAGRLPVALIEQIGSKAKQLASEGQANGQSVLDQMVGCVQDVMTHMAKADLQVFGRPMAMAMRSTSSDEILEATVQSVRSVEWEALSPIEQAKLSLAVARYALDLESES
ncbi:MAG: hypothetical protein AAFV90_03395 [Cyanobacteria bacterium J06634_5]